MHHEQFKQSQTAAAYVANALDSQTQESFEIHMMTCPNCVEDVEAWRAIKRHLPRETAPLRVVAPPATRQTPLFAWRLAASLGAATLIGGAAGWYGRSAHEMQLAGEGTAFFNLPAVTRGVGDCTAVRYTADTRFVVVRVPGVEDGRRVVATDVQGLELDQDSYVARLQGDRSWIVRFAARTLTGNAVHLETRAPGSHGEPLGCITGQSAS